MRIEHSYQVDGNTVTVRVERNEERYRVTIGDKVYEVDLRQPEAGHLQLVVDGQRFEAYVARGDQGHYVALDGQSWTLARPEPEPRRAGVGAAGWGHPGGLEATMPAKILDVWVAAGDSVTRGQTLVLLEAMKMELRITAPYDGRVSQVLCEAGEVVDRGQLLVELTPNLT
jgi:biotin carboxyl carrier protein